MFWPVSSFVDDAFTTIPPIVTFLRSNKFSVFTGNPPRLEACYNHDTFNLSAASLSCGTEERKILGTN